MILDRLIFLAAEHKMSPSIRFHKITFILVTCLTLLVSNNDGGVIKDIYEKITHSNNTHDTVDQSSPICGSTIFSTKDQKAVSPEIILITNRSSKRRNEYSDSRERSTYNSSSRDGPVRHKRAVKEVAKEFRFNVENVTLDDLERNGFNRNAPASFLIHGFTSGYPLQAWISAIVEAYTIDRQTSDGYDQDESSPNSGNYQSGGHSSNHFQGGHSNNHGRDRRQTSAPRSSIYDEYSNQHNSKELEHNLFIINWNYAARGIVYPRAVANIPTVATYVTRFINEKLLAEYGMDPRRIQLIGHSLGAHLAGFVGKNTRSKLGRIYGLDPAGPCFGSITGPLYSSENRLGPDDAEEVITIHTNSALLGIDKPLGKYSVFVEGGATQPGCRGGGGVLKSIGTLTWDGGDFDTVSCSHSRAPNLLTYRHNQLDTQDDCQLVAYECKDWESFVNGHCGLCQEGSSLGAASGKDPFQPVDCLRIGLDWQYYKASNNNDRTPQYDRQTSRRPSNDYDSSPGYDQYQNNRYNQSNSNNDFTSTRRPSHGHDHRDRENDRETSSRSPYDNNRENQYDREKDRRTTSSRPNYDTNNHYDRGTPSRRPVNNREKRTPEVRHTRDVEDKMMTRGLFSPIIDTVHDTVGNIKRDKSGKSKYMFLKTGDTQPYCVFQYQVILELNRPFPSGKPPISLLLQDSEHKSGRYKEQNSLSNDEFGNRVSDRVYTHLLTSTKKLKKIDHGTLLFRDGLPDGHSVLKHLHINYMSHSDPNVRRILSSRLCPVKTDTDRGVKATSENRFYFEPCDGRNSYS